MYDGTNFKPVAADDAHSVIVPRHPTRAEVEALIRRARAERSAAIAEAIARVIAGAIQWLRRQREKAAAVRELASLDDRSLADIGVDRAQIQDLIYGAERAGAAARGEMLVAFVNDKIVRPVRAWRLRVRTRNELMGLDDAMLRDIGVERGQIDGIAAAVAAAKAEGRDTPVTAALVLGGFDLPQPANANVLARRAVHDAAD